MLNDYSASAGVPQLMNDSEGVAFAKSEEEVALAHAQGKKERDKSKVTCQRCQEKGHYSYECSAPAPIPRDNGAMLQLNAAVDNISDD
mmetsp:Transcript_63262/g.187050  ORF Transcript_63262/g.187050 Transcript_63262/m.187050 type:complete len:88 (+) Transcript_63262:272-535(+)